MTVHSAATAIDYINQIQQKNLKTAAIRHNMTKPGSGTFMDWIVQETKDLQALSDTQPSDQLLNDDATKERFQQYYEVFIHLEKTFNPIAPLRAIEGSCPELRACFWASGVILLHFSQSRVT